MKKIINNQKTELEKVPLQSKDVTLYVVSKDSLESPLNSTQSTQSNSNNHMNYFSERGAKDYGSY